MRTARILLCLAAAAPSPARAAQPVPGAYELLQAVREAYSALDVYSDEGELEGPASADGAPADRTRFRVAARRDGVPVVELASGGIDEPWRSVEPGRPLERSLGEGARQALVVPALLAEGSGALSEPTAALVEERVECDGSLCWTLRLAGPEPGLERRLWVDVESHLLHAVEVEIDGDPPRRWMARHRILAASTRQAPAGDSAPAAQQEPAAGFAETIEVALVSLPARVFDASGAAVPGLAADDFRLLVGGSEVAVEAAIWIDPAHPLADSERAELVAAGIPPPPDGRLVVFFVQTSLEGSRLVGQVRTLPHAQRFVERLGPLDRAAVVSFDSHLKLRQDFTRDRDLVREALERSIVAGPSAPPRSQAALSLARGFDARAALDAASPERALELTARALIPIPGEKTLVYLGWGLGELSPTGVRMTARYEDAMRALAAAETTVFVLDVSDSDYHSLEVGLRQVAADTGGTYAKTRIAPAGVTERLLGALDGHYVVYFRSPDGAPGRRVRLELRDRSVGEVLTPQLRTP